MKVLLWVLCAIGILLLALGGIAFWWWKTQMPDMRNEATAQIQQGREDGKTRAEPECLESALQWRSEPRYQSFSGTILLSVRLRGCLAESRLAPTFCKDTPKKDELFASAAWMAEQCEKPIADGKLSQSACQALYQQVLQYCHSPERHRKREASANG